MSQQIKYGTDYVLISDHEIGVPDGFVFVTTCPAGFYYARPGITAKMIREAMKSRTP